MTQIQTHYDILSVARNAPPEVIRAAYRALSQQYHPDRNLGKEEAARIMVEINASYEMLSDPKKRQEYDLWVAQQEKSKGHAPNTQNETIDTEQTSIAQSTPGVGLRGILKIPFEVTLGCLAWLLFVFPSAIVCIFCFMLIFTALTGCGLSLYSYVHQWPLFNNYFPIAWFAISVVASILIYGRVHKVLVRIKEYLSKNVKSEAFGNKA